MLPAVTAAHLFQLIRTNTSWKRRGPVVEGTAPLIDGGGSVRTIVLDGFCNTHQVLTLGRVAR
jgi:hypothetical protein